MVIISFIGCFAAALGLGGNNGLEKVNPSEISCPEHVFETQYHELDFLNGALTTHSYFVAIAHMTAKNDPRSMSLCARWSPSVSNYFPDKMMVCYLVARRPTAACQVTVHDHHVCG
jgi:hypothetical protein